MSNKNLDKQVLGPGVKLAAMVKAALEPLPEVHEDWGDFYVAEVKLVCRSGGSLETIGYLVPDEGTGNTLDFYTYKDDE